MISVCRRLDLNEKVHIFQKVDFMSGKQKRSKSSDDFSGNETLWISLLRVTGVIFKNEATYLWLI